MRTAETSRAPPSSGVGSVYLIGRSWFAKSVGNRKQPSVGAEDSNRLLSRALMGESQFAKKTGHANSVFLKIFAKRLQQPVEQEDTTLEISRISHVSADPEVLSPFQRAARSDRMYRAVTDYWLSAQPMVGSTMRVSAAVTTGAGRLVSPFRKAGRSSSGAKER
jgi:hypothetical protein